MRTALGLAPPLLVLRTVYVPLLLTPPAINLPVSTNRPQPSIALFSQIIVASSQPSSPVSCSPTRHAVARAALSQMQLSQRPGSPSRSSAEHTASKSRSTPCDSTSGPRSSRDPRHSSHITQPGAQLRTIANRCCCARAFLQPGHHKPCSYVASGPNAAAQPCPSHKDIRELVLSQASERGLVQRCLRSPVPSACSHLDRVLNHPSSRQHAASWPPPGGAGPCRPRDQQGAIPQHHRLHRWPPPRLTTLSTLERFRGPIS